MQGREGMGDPRENPPTSGIIRHDSSCENPGIQPRFAWSGGEQSNHINKAPHLSECKHKHTRPWQAAPSCQKEAGCPSGECLQGNYAPEAVVCLFARSGVSVDPRGVGRLPPPQTTLAMATLHWRRSTVWLGLAVLFAVTSYTSVLACSCMLEHPQTHACTADFGTSQSLSVLGELYFYGMFTTELALLLHPDTRSEDIRVLSVYYWLRVLQGVSSDERRSNVGGNPENPMMTKSVDTVWHYSSESIVYIQNSITPLDCQRIKEYATLSQDCEASREKGAKLKYGYRIRLERASQKQSNDTHKTPYDGVKRCRERKIKNIKASERVNVDVKNVNCTPAGDIFYYSPLHVSLNSIAARVTILTGGVSVDSFRARIVATHSSNFKVKKFNCMGMVQRV
ncbi:hypothetical protein PR048_010760 [Dryococelus australis]|uniref:Uncharacterized protein n=1 Tax=Dryococelus australis TaxID=614101 RepID=A0ABQ9I3M7_9NEOP|nr:hypothetical protein PR048_010760 [Dryococelus australis]